MGRFVGGLRIRRRSFPRWPVWWDLTQQPSARHGTILLRCGPGTQAGTLKLTVNGAITDNLASSATIFVQGAGGNDTFTVTAAPAASLILDGGGGSDTYNVTFGTGIAGKVVITDSGTSGTDQFTANGTTGNDYIAIR